MRIGSAIAAGGIFAAAGIIAWIIVASGSGPVFGLSETVVRAALPLIGLPVGAGLVILVQAGFRAGGLESAEGAKGVEPMLVAAAAGATVLLAIGTVTDRISPLGAALVLMLGTGALMALSRALRDLAETQGVAFESHWGGLAGGMGGWRLSSASVTLLLTIILVGAVVGAAMTTDGGSGGAGGNSPSNGSGGGGNKVDSSGSGTGGNISGGGGSFGGGGAGSTVPPAPGTAGGNGSSTALPGPAGGGNSSSTEPAAAGANTSSPAADRNRGR